MPESRNGKHNVQRTKEALTSLLIIGAAGLTLFEAAQSLCWPVQHDYPSLMYMIYSINVFHYVPYKDISDIITPGALAIYCLVGKILGYEDVHFRLMDIVWMSAILAVTCRFMMEFGWKVALLGSTIFGLIYFSTQSYNFVFARENLILLPLSAAVGRTFSVKNNRTAGTAFVVGLLFGVCATIKPQAAIGLPVCVVFLLWETAPGGRGGWAFFRQLLRIAGSAGAGFGIPIAVMLGALQRHGALIPFLQVVTDQWPIYAQYSGEGELVSGLQRLKFLAKAFFVFGGNALLLISGVLGFFVSFCLSNLTRRQENRLLFLVGLAVAYSLYPALGGKLWSYQWMFFVYFVVLICALCAVDQPQARKGLQQLFPILVLAATLAPYVSQGIFRTVAYGIDGSNLPKEKEQQAAEIAAGLRPLLKAGDAVQAWGDGNVDSRAVLMTGAKPATSFLWVNWLLYDITLRPYSVHPGVQRLRERFLREFQTAQPRFFVEVEGTPLGRPGESVHPELQALRNLLDSQYTVRVQGPGFRILEKNDGTGS